VSQVAESAAERPWVGIGAGTAALGSAALAYRLRRPQSLWQKSGERAEELFSQTGKRAAETVTDEAADTADRVARAASSIWRRLQTISAESGKLYGRTRKLIA
jgi:hypothetical protein